MSEVIRTYGELVRADDGDEDLFHFRMSDGSTDRVGDIIDPEGWTLTKFRSNPIALYGHNSRDLPIGRWQNVRQEAGSLIGSLRLAEVGTSPFIDGVRSLLKQGILRACSVGFRALKAEPLDPDKPWGGQRYMKSELLECSVVAVPANANAVALRSLDTLPDEVRQMLLAESGNRQHVTRSARSTAGSGATPPRRNTPMNLSERIQAAQTDLIALRDEQAPLLKLVNEDGEDLNDEQQADFDRIEDEAGKVQKRLDTYRATERSLGLAAQNRQQNDQHQQIIIPPNGRQQIMRGGSPRERPMDLLVKLGVLHFKAFAQRRPIDIVRLETYPDRTDMDAIVKAVTNPAQTTVAGWAAELVETAIEDFIEALKPISAYGELASLGIRFTFGRNGVLKIPRRNKVKNAAGDLRGAFVGEGQPIPVRRGSIGSVSLTPHKMGVISDYTREMAAHSTPAIENLIREGIVEDTADAIDTALLDAVAADAIRPAGLLNGVTPIAGTAGGGVAAMTADIQAILAPFIAANAADRLVFLINPTLVFKLQWASTAVGVYPFRDMVAAGNIGGIPFVKSTNVPATVLICLRYADFASSTADTPEFDVSDVATLHEDDGSYPADQAMRPGTTTVLPIVDGAGAAAKPVRSLWQTASIGIRMLLDMDWAMRRAGMVQEVTGITW